MDLGLWVWLDWTVRGHLIDMVSSTVECEVPCGVLIVSQIYVVGVVVLMRIDIWMAAGLFAGLCRGQKLCADRQMHVSSMKELSRHHVDIRPELLRTQALPGAHQSPRFSGMA